jgi:hypothetical protein
MMLSVPFVVESLLPGFGGIESVLSRDVVPRLPSKKTSIAFEQELPTPSRLQEVHDDGDDDAYSLDEESFGADDDDVAAEGDA